MPRGIGLLLLACLAAPALAQDVNIPASEPVAEEEAAPAPAKPAKAGKPAKAEKETLPAVEEKAPDSNLAMLQGLNKVTGRVSAVEAPLGTVARFGNLEIIARRCWKSLPEDRPENAALLEIRELKTGEEPEEIFTGWMFSSTPGLSGLEHPVYDITVLACEFRKDVENLEPEKK